MIIVLLIKIREGDFIKYLFILFNHLVASVWWISLDDNINLFIFPELKTS